MEYIPVLLLLGIGAALGGVILLLSSLLGPRIKNRRKDLPFECGVPPAQGSQGRYSVRFYLIAILFLLFDVEAIFFFPFAMVYREYLSFGMAIFLTMGFFVGVLLLGYYYVLRKGALEWD